MKLWITTIWAVLSVGRAHAQSGMPTATTLAMIALFAVMFLIPIGYFVAAWRVDKRAAVARAWPTARGVITRSAHKIERVNGVAWFAPDIGYQFAVDGRTFEGKRLRLGMDTARSGKAMASMLAPYPVEGRVQVHYDPADPANNVLEPVANTAGYRRVGWIFLAVLGLIAAAVVAANLR